MKLSKRQMDESLEWKKKIITPRIAVIGVVENDNGELLIINRKYQPFGHAFPGGMMEVGETIEETGLREVLEETNIRAAPVGILNIISDPKYDPRWHVVVVHVIMKGNGIPKAADDALSAEWVKNTPKLKNIVISSCKETLKDYEDYKNNKIQLLRLR